MASLPRTFGEPALGLLPQAGVEGVAEAVAEKAIRAAEPHASRVRVIVIAPGFVWVRRA